MNPTQKENEREKDATRVANVRANMTEEQRQNRIFFQALLWKWMCYVTEPCSISSTFENPFPPDGDFAVIMPDQEMHLQNHEIL